MAQIISGKMHKRLGIKKHSDLVDREVADFIGLGGKDFTEANLRRLEARIRGQIDTERSSKQASSKRHSSKRLSKVGEQVLSGAGSKAAASERSGHQSVRTISHSQKSLGSHLSQTSRPIKEDPWGEILRFNAELYQEEIKRKEAGRLKQKALIKEALDQ